MGAIILVCSLERAGARIDPHAHGASEADLDRLAALLTSCCLSDQARNDHDLGRETLTVLSAVRNHGPAPIDAS